MPTVMITGANRGIGLGLAKAYLKNGWAVITTARSPEKASELNGLGGVEVYTLDVTDHKAIDDLAEKLKGRPIDVLINNAGVLGSADFEKGSLDQSIGSMDFGGMRHTLEVNTISPLKVSEAFLPNLEAGDQKKLITITSGMGSIGTTGGGYISYRTSKAGVNAVMKNISIPLKDKGIAVAVLHPGWVKTDMGSAAAPTEVSESVAGLVKQIDALTLEQTGCFRDFTGKEIPW